MASAVSCQRPEIPPSAAADEGETLTAEGVPATENSVPHGITVPTPAAADGDVVEVAASDPRWEEFPSFGVALRRPVDWEAERQVPFHDFLARWLPADASSEDWSQFTISLTHSRGETLRQAAEAAIARVTPPERRGAYRFDALSIDGEPALVARPHRLGQQPQEGPPVLGPIYVATHEGYLMTLLFLIDDPKEISLARDVVASLRWLQRRPLLEVLRLSDHLTTVLGGKGQLRLPQQMRLDPLRSSAERLSGVAFDWAGGQDGIALELHRVQAPDHRLATQARVYAETIEARTQLNGLLQFAPLAKNPQVWASEYLEGRFPDGQGGEVLRHSRYAVWQLAAGEFAHLQIVLNDEMVRLEEDRHRALQVINGLLESCQRLPDREAVPAVAAPLSEVVQETSADKAEKPNEK